MKRIISAMLCLVLLVSFTVTTAVADSGNTMQPGASISTDALLDEIANEQHIQITVPSNPEKPETVDLSTRQVSTFSNVREVALDSEELVYQKLDFSNAIDVTTEVLGNHAQVNAVTGDDITTDLPENQPPVAEPLGLV